MLADGRWFSPDTPVSSTTKTGRHDIAEILLKVALNIKNQINCQLNFHRNYDSEIPLFLIDVKTFCHKNDPTT